LFKINDKKIYVKVVNFVETLKIDEIIKYYLLKKNNDIIGLLKENIDIDSDAGVKKYKINLKELLNKELLKKSLEVFEEKNTENLFLSIIQLIERLETDKSVKNDILEKNDKLIEKFRKDKDIVKYKNGFLKLLKLSNLDETKELLKKIPSFPPTPDFTKFKPKPLDETKELLKKIPSFPPTPDFLKGRNPQTLDETNPSPPSTPDFLKGQEPRPPTPPRKNPFQVIRNPRTKILGTKYRKGDSDSEEEGFSYSDSDSE